MSSKKGRVQIFQEKCSISMFRKIFLQFAEIRFGLLLIYPQLIMLVYTNHRTMEQLEWRYLVYLKPLSLKASLRVVRRCQLLLDFQQQF